VAESCVNRESRRESAPPPALRSQTRALLHDLTPRAARCMHTCASERQGGNARFISARCSAALFSRHRFARSLTTSPLCRSMKRLRRFTRNTRGESRGPSGLLLKNEAAIARQSASAAQSSLRSRLINQSERPFHRGSGRPPRTRAKRDKLLHNDAIIVYLTRDTRITLDKRVYARLRVIYMRYYVTAKRIIAPSSRYIGHSRVGDSPRRCL